MNLEYTNKTYYQLSIKAGLAIERREIYDTAKEVEDRLREIKKQVGKENIKEFIKENIRIFQVKKMDVVNLGKGIKNENDN